MILTDRLYEFRWDPLQSVCLWISNSSHWPRAASLLRSPSKAKRVDIDERRMPHFSVVGRPPNGRRERNRMKTEAADLGEDGR